MAYSTTPVPAPLPRLALPFASLFGALGDSLSRSRQIFALSELSDDELAERGLRRGQIAGFVAHEDYWR